MIQEHRNTPRLQELKPRIVVMGVGGAGGNAINNMIRSGLEGVEFVAANTDAQALAMSRASHVIQMGVQLTEGLGAGSKPEIGAAAAEEAIEDLRAAISGAHMIFITAGMGGGTGTGAAPVIGRIARELGVLTVGVVTKPFEFEGRHRAESAESGIAQLTEHVDTLIVIPNQNLFLLANEQTTFTEAFEMADDVLYSGVACITDLMVKEGLINLDFADVRVVMGSMGKALMGTGMASGENRGRIAAEAAITNRLLDNVSLAGAKGVLISIMGGKDLTLYEVQNSAERIREEAAPKANIIVGASFDEELEGKIRVSVLATGIDQAGLEVDRKIAMPEDMPDFLASEKVATKEETVKAVKEGVKDKVMPQPSVETSLKEMDFFGSSTSIFIKAQNVPQKESFDWEAPAANTASLETALADSSQAAMSSHQDVNQKKSAIWQKSEQRAGCQSDLTGQKTESERSVESSLETMNVKPGSLAMKEATAHIDFSTDRAETLAVSGGSLAENIAVDGFNDDAKGGLVDRLSRMNLFGIKGKMLSGESDSSGENPERKTSETLANSDVMISGDLEEHDESVAEIPAFFRRQHIIK